MASNYDRRINLYVNIDGKEVKNNVQSIRAEMSNLVNAQKQMTIGSNEYVDASSKIKQLKGILDGHNKSMKNAESPIQSLIGTAKGLLPAFGFAAMGALATHAFGKITSATDAMADKWEFAVAGMKNGIDYFWKTLASGDWGNFMSNLREAVRVGGEYARMMDHIGDSSRALSMVESDSREQALKLEMDVKNKTLSKEERIAAGKARIQLEKDLSDKRTKIAQEELDAELMIASQRTGLNKDQLIQITKDIDSEARLRAEAYNNDLARYTTLKNQNVVQYSSPTVGYGTGKQLPDTKEMIELKKGMDSAPDSVKAYAIALTAYSNLTEESMDKIAAAYNKRNEAENSAVENTKKVITNVNSLLAGQAKEEEDLLKDLEKKKNQERKEEADSAIEILDNENNERIKRLAEQYEKGKLSDTTFKIASLTAEEAYLAQKKAILEKYGQSTIDIEADINQKRIDAQAAFNEGMKELLKEVSDMEKEQAKADNEEILASIEEGKKATEENKKLKEEEKKEQKEKVNEYLDFANMAGETFAQLLNDQEADFSDYLNSILVMSLDALHQYFLIKKAELWIDAAAGAATGRFWKIAKAVAAVTVMEIAYQSVRGALTSKKSKSNSKYATGGFTHGEATYIAGEDGKEWIAPNWMISHPLTGRIISGLEDMRRNPINVTTGAFQTSINRGFANEGYTSTETDATHNYNLPTNNPAGRDPELTAAINNNTRAIAMLMKNGVQFPIFAFKKQYEEVSDLINQTGMPGFDKK